MLAIGTRFFGKNKEKDLPRLDKFITCTRQFSNTSTYFAVNVEEDTIDTMHHIARDQEGYCVRIIPVRPWGYVAPLNAIVLKAAQEQAEHLLIASSEYPPNYEHVAILKSHFDENTLVVGACFSEHAYKPGTHEGKGSTVPWNMFALWNLHYLARTGFMMAGDASFNSLYAGMAEFTTIAVFQMLFPHLTAKVVNVPGIGGIWNTDGWDEERHMLHRKKIESVNERPAQQLAWAKLNPPMVMHL